MSYWQGKTVVITGGSSGLGFALAREYGAAGAGVVVAARNEQRLQQATQQLCDAGCDATCVVCDISCQADVDRLVAGAVQRNGRIDALVNCAGRSTRGAVLDVTVDDFRELLEINFLGAVRCTRAAAPYVIESRGHIVNIASLAAKSAAPHLGAYPVSKFPLAAYSQQLRLELGKQGVHVLLVCPGPIQRDDAGNRYDDRADGLPDSARRPGGGVKLKGIPADRLARKILYACQRRKAELVLPGKARLLFAIAQLSPALGDWLLQKWT